MLLTRVRRYLFICHTWKTLLNHVFEDLRKTKAPNNQVLQSDLQKKVMEKLMGLQYKIVYKKGNENVAADALSRVGHMMAL
jgi:predicted nuclease of restriction endonuclease-like RecB superfamily